MADPLAPARRAVACPAWRWMPGMLAIWPDFGAWCRIVSVSDDGAIEWREGEPPAWDVDTAAALPDLTDPATLGCLLALVREALSDPGAWCESDMGDLSRWAVYRSHREPPHRVSYGDTEAEALVAALESAP